MGDSLLLWMALALTVFWCVGVYNRLMRMRARGLEAFGLVEKHLRQYAELLREQGPQLESDRTPTTLDSVDDSTVMWKALVAATDDLDLALKEARAAPLQVEPTTRLVAASEALQHTWGILCDTPADLAGSLVPDGMPKRWEVISLSVATSRHAFNQIVNSYNAALGQFPASLIVGVMGFKPSGTL